MKYGAHSYIFIDRWSDDHLDILDQVKTLGLDCFEIGVGDDVPFDTAKTRARAESLGLELMTSPGGAWPFSADVSSDDPGERAEGIAWHKKRIDEAVELGALAYCGALYGHPGTVKRRRPPADEYKWTAEGLHQLGVYAAENNLLLGLEPMSHFRTHLVNTPRQMTSLISLADHPNLRILFDTYHMITELTDYRSGIEDAGDLLWGLHACENDRGAPGGGLVPWEEIFAGFADLNFDGYIMMESYNSALGDFAFERGMFHGVCHDPKAFLREGLAFLKSR